MKKSAVDTNCQIMTYKGYTANIEYDELDNIFVGRLADIRDIVCFHGKNIDELQSAFHESVDDYVKGCNKLDQQTT